MLEEDYKLKIRL